MIHLETKKFVWKIDEYGITRAFTAVDSGFNLADTANPAPFCRLMSDAREIAPVSVRFQDNCLYVAFPGATASSGGVEARIAVENCRDYLILRLQTAPPPEFDGLILLDVPLRMGAAAMNDFVAAAVALNIRTRVDELPGPQTRLRARCYRKFGMDNAASAIVAAPFDQMRAILKQVVNNAPELPHSPLGGPWALDAAKNFTSYLFGVATPDTVDEWIALCHDFGMDQIHFSGGRAFRYGDYHVDTAFFPNGLSDVRHVVERLHKNGIMAGIHSLSFSINTTASYITPIPDKRLATEAVYTLAKNLSAEDEAVTLLEDTAGLPRETSYHVRRSMTLRIDDELIEYAVLRDKPPYGLGGCKRGAWGTRAAPHRAGAPAHHLCACWGMFAPDGESTLFGEIAGNIARIVNECGFDMVYLDGLDGAHIFGGEEGRWHYGGRFAFEVFNRLKHPVIMEMAAFLHHLWFLRSRMGAWDHPTRGFTSFMDHHVRSNKQCARIFLPSHLGWWAPRVANAPDTTTTEIEKMSGLACKNQTTFAEDVEYLCDQALATGAGFALQGLNLQAMREKPHLRRLGTAFKKYSGARRQIPATSAPDDAINAQDHAAIAGTQHRVKTLSHIVTGLDDGSNTWRVEHHGAARAVKIRIETLWSVAPYDDERGVVLAEFRAPDEFKADMKAVRILNSGKTYSYPGAAPGMRAWLTPVPDTPPECSAAAAAQFKAVRQGDGQFPVSTPTDCLSILDHGERIYMEHPASWIWLGKKFDAELDLTQSPAFGLWVYGDGSGAVLNVQIAGPEHSQALEDHYVPLDFSGWRYVELVEPESERFEQYGWPYGRCVYDIYRATIQYAKVAGLNLWLNNVSATRETCCRISQIRALPLIKTKIINPVLHIGARAVYLPFELAAGDWIEIMPDGMATAFAPDGVELKSMPVPGGGLLMDAGMNDFTFNAESVTSHCRARVTTVARQ